MILILKQQQGWKTHSITMLVTKCNFFFKKMEPDTFSRNVESLFGIASRTLTFGKHSRFSLPFCPTFLSKKAKTLKGGTKPTSISHINTHQPCTSRCRCRNPRRRPHRLRTSISGTQKIQRSFAHAQTSLPVLCVACLLENGKGFVLAWPIGELGRAREERKIRCKIELVGRKILSVF